MNMTWLKRAEHEREQKATNQDVFYRTSLKYGKNPNHSDNYVGVPWRIYDASTTMNQFPLNVPRRSIAEDQQWKMKNSFETMSPHASYRDRVKDMLK